MLESHWGRTVMQGSYYTEGVTPGLPCASISLRNATVTLHQNPKPALRTLISRPFTVSDDHFQASAHRVSARVRGTSLTTQSDLHGIQTRDDGVFD